MTMINIMTSKSEGTLGNAHALEVTGDILVPELCNKAIVLAMENNDRYFEIRTNRVLAEGAWGLIVLEWYPGGRIAKKTRMGWDITYHMTEEELQCATEKANRLEAELFPKPKQPLIKDEA